MDSHAELVKNIDKSGKQVKTEQDWKKYKLLNNIDNDKKKKLFKIRNNLLGRNMQLKLIMEMG